MVTQRVIMCSGGLSFPAVGTDGTGHRLLASLGVQQAPTYPALTPLLGAWGWGRVTVQDLLDGIYVIFVAELWPSAGGDRRSEIGKADLRSRELTTGAAWGSFSPEHALSGLELSVPVLGVVLKLTSIPKLTR